MPMNFNFNNPTNLIFGKGALNKLSTPVMSSLSRWQRRMYDGALFSFKGDFLDYLGLESMGVFTAHGAENGSPQKLEELKLLGASLK